MEKPINEVRLINMTEFASRVCMGPGSVTRTQDAALRDITRPYKSLAWTTALAIVRERMEGAKRNADELSGRDITDDSRAYAEGRYHALRDCLEEMEERGKP